jgi:hypothetical protein
MADTPLTPSGGSDSKTYATTKIAGYFPINVYNNKYCQCSGKCEIDDWYLSVCACVCGCSTCQKVLEKKKSMAYILDTKNTTKKFDCCG